MPATRPIVRRAIVTGENVGPPNPMQPHDDRPALVSRAHGCGVPRRSSPRASAHACATHHPRRACIGGARRCRRSGRDEPRAIHVRRCRQHRCDPAGRSRCARGLGLCADVRCRRDPGHDHRDGICPDAWRQRSHVQWRRWHRQCGYRDDAHRGRTRRRNDRQDRRGRRRQVRDEPAGFHRCAARCADDRRVRSRRRNARRAGDRRRNELQSRDRRHNPEAQPKRGDRDLDHADAADIRGSAGDWLRQASHHDSCRQRRERRRLHRATGGHRCNRHRLIHAIDRRRRPRRASHSSPSTRSG